MQQLTDAIPSAGLVLLGAVAAKVIDWLLAFRSGENERIAKTYDAVNAAQKALTDSLFQQISQLRVELTDLRDQNTQIAERYQAALDRIEQLDSEVLRLREHIESMAGNAGG